MANDTADVLSLSHFSPERYLRHIYSREQKVTDYRSCYDKPKGFWVSVDGEYDWEHWCGSENFGIGEHRHRVHLASNHKVLHLTTSWDVLDFRHEYQGLKRWGTNNQWTDIYIRWEDVARDYQGIIIAPYQWSLRMEENWYYGWDCASGCIWDATAIACVEPVLALEAA